MKVIDIIDDYKPCPFCGSYDIEIYANTDIYDPVKMPKGVDIPDGSIIQVKEAFESGYKKKDGSLGRQLIIMDFDLEEKEGFQELEEQLPF